MLTTEEFIDKAKKVHNKFDYSKDKERPVCIQTGNFGKPKGPWKRMPNENLFREKC